ncbi:MAG: hypothetical protein D4R41_00790, partial [Sediminibacterium sp.]
MSRYSTKLVYVLLILLSFSFQLWANTPVKTIKTTGFKLEKLSINDKDKLKNSKVLVYTKNGKGYVHDNIASAVASIKEMGVENHFTVDVSDDPSVTVYYTNLTLPSYSEV